MSLDQATGDRPIHFPADAAHFGFDAEVSTIFPDMARRAIPNFYESHAAHVEMLLPLLPPQGQVHVLDIGASRGAFFKELKDRVGAIELRERFNLHAIDNSPDMCRYLANDFPTAWVQELDVTSDEFLFGREKYDVVCMHYVLQFVPPAKQVEVLRAVMRRVKPGGVLIYGHKAQHYGALGDLAHEQYINFRINNGYSRAEIEAKTKALKGSMSSANHEVILDIVRTDFTFLQETFRFMMFSTFMAVK